jgi:hypothetical protein
MEIPTMILPALMLGFGSYASAAHGAAVSFEKEPLGPLASSLTSWKTGVTGSGKASWTVESDPSAPSKGQVLKQSAEGTFPWAVKSDVSLSDGFVETKFKTVSGKEDQAGGVIWRFKDGNNYYIARANALEDNVTIYHTTDGKRRSFKSMDLKVSPGEWHTLRVEFKGKEFRVLFDGKEMLAQDETISGPGAVGLWTKADSVTLFDDFIYTDSPAKADPSPSPQRPALKGKKK